MKKILVLIFFSVALLVSCESSKKQELSKDIATKEDIQTKKDLANKGDIYAPFHVGYCYAHGKNCKSEAEWDALVKPYMEE